MSSPSLATGNGNKRESDLLSPSPSAKHAKLEPVHIETILIDPNFDLTLESLYDGFVTSFKVCSAILERSSKMLASLLSDKYQERKPEDEESHWVVRLKELEPRVLEMILRYMHTSVATPLQGLTIAEMYDVVIVIDYLKCLKPFQDLAREQWLATIWSNHPLSPENCCGEMLYIAMRLGLEELVGSMLDVLQKEVNSLDDAAYHAGPMPSSRLCRNVAMPLTLRDNKPVTFDTRLGTYKIPEVLKNQRDKIWNVENETKHEALKMYHDALAPFFPRPGKDKTQTCEATTRQCQRVTRVHCHDIICGSLWQELCDKDMTEHSFHLDAHQGSSVKACFSKLRGLNVQGFERKRYTCHDECNPIRGVRKRLDEMEEHFDAEVEVRNRFDWPQALKEFVQECKDDV